MAELIFSNESKCIRLVSLNIFLYFKILSKNQPVLRNMVIFSGLLETTWAIDGVCQSDEDSLQLRHAVSQIKLVILLLIYPRRR